MYKLHLILKYLLKRRIAWVSLIAVILCTAMVLVVISVMGGWLRMFEQSFHGLTGDIIVEGQSGLTGFPYYQEMVDEIEKLPEAEAAMPVITSYGLINIANRKNDGVQVIGIPIEKVGKVNEFPASLYRQHLGLLEAAKKPEVSPIRKEMLTKLAALPPTFGLINKARAPISALPAGVKIPDAYADRLRFDANAGLLTYDGKMTREEHDELIALSSDATYREAIDFLFDQAFELVDYNSIGRNSRANLTGRPGMIPGAGVLDIRKDAEGKIVNRKPFLYRLPVVLAVLGRSPGGGVSFDISNKVERPYWIVDDSRTGISIYDSSTVFVPFEVLQADLKMNEQRGIDTKTKKEIIEPARATDVHVKVKPGVDLDKARDAVAVAVERVIARHRSSDDIFAFGDDPTVKTWREDKADYIKAIEKEKLLVTILFGIISLVAVFLIFCIFYMIVVEKTKDIGIIKSVGATAQGVAGIFLGYGLAIGLVGAGLGFLAAYLITRYINEIHTWMGRALGMQIWDPRVYLFDKIPNHMNPRETAIILACAVVSAVMGAIIPALRAARMNPVDALRWE